MVIAALFAAAGLLVWAWLYARTAEPAIVATLTLIVGYVLGHSFWNLHVGPLPLTLDRLMLVGLAGLFGWRHWRGELKASAVSVVDWALAATLVWLSLSAVLNRPPEGVVPTSPFWRLVMSFWAPAFLFLVARQSTLGPRTAHRVLALLAALGGYLALTALAETVGAWPLVFPRYIADPELGLHFGRARGPALNSVSLGIFLSICFWAAWVLLPRVGRLWQLVLLGSMPLMAFGVLLTYTRSTWIGLVASGVAVIALQVPRRSRLPVLGGIGVVGALMAGVLWQSVLNLEREDSGNVSKHSVQQRTAFTYVSAKMVADHPLWGVGFGRFYDQKLPYLSDRTQSFELESLRRLHHHNTLLSLLTETGIVGLAAYLGVLAGLLACGWRLAQLSQAAPHERALGTLLVAAVMVYLPSAVFHDLTHLHNDQWLLLLIAGLAVGCERRHSPLTSAPRSRLARSAPPPACRARAPSDAPKDHSMNDSSRVSLFGMKIDRLTLRHATTRVLEWCAAPREGMCRYVVTPNVDHTVMHRTRTDLRSAYESASLVLADGAPLIAASRLLGKPLPERVAGSDLTPAVLKAAGGSRPPLRVFLLGAGPGIADQAAGNILREHKGVEIVGTHCPPIGFEKDEQQTKAALDAVAAAQPDLLIIGLGAPKQELWVAQHHDKLQAKVALCVGATIDFLAGHKQRSPVWMQRVGMEWIHRLASEPRRLATRYARDAWVFPQIVWQEYRRAAGA